MKKAPSKMTGLFFGNNCENKKHANTLRRLSNFRQFTRGTLYKIEACFLNTLIC